MPGKIRNKKRNKRRRMAALAKSYHEMDGSTSLQDSRLLDNSGESTDFPKTAIVAKSVLTPSTPLPPFPAGSFSAERDNGSEVSYSVDAGNCRTSHMTDIMLDESSHDLIKSYKIEDERLLGAINSGPSCEIVEKLHTRDNPFTPDGLNQALISACRRGHKVLVQTLVRVGANIEHRDENGNTPLLICAEQGFTNIVRFLVSRHADVNARNSTANTALILSVRLAGSTDLTRFLLGQQDVDIHHENQDGDTALNRTTRLMNVDTMRLLLEKSLARTKDRGYRNAHVITHETDTCFFHSRAQKIKQEAIAARAGLAQVYEMLKEHVITGTSPLELAIKARDTKSLDIFLHCEWFFSSEKKMYVDRALMYMFPNSRHAVVQRYSATELTIIQRLLQNGADVNQGYWSKPISHAVKSGDFQLVELMCTHGAELNRHSYSGEQDPLCIAAKNCRRDIIELLLKHGADTNRYGYFETPLDYALRNDHMECAKLLIQGGAEMDVACALRSAVEHQRPNYMHFLFENYKHDFIDYFSQQTLNVRKLLISAVEKGNSDIIGGILDAGVGVNEVDSSGQTPLMAAKNRAVAKFLIQRGADVNQVVEGRNGIETPLSRVIKNRKCVHAHTVELCKVLIDNGAMVNCRGGEGETPLMMAASQDGCVSMLEMLLDSGADVADKDDKGNTALVLAITNGNSLNSFHLLNFNSNRKSAVNIQNNEGLTPLIISVMKGNVAIMKRLIVEGADVNMKDNNDNAALHHLLITWPCDTDDVSASMLLAGSHSNLINSEEILKSLLKAGSHVNCQNSEGLSPLMLAAKKSKLSLMSKLLDAGADVNAVCKNNHSQTAISFLSETTNLGNDNIQCIESLLERGASSSYLSHGCLHKLIFKDTINVIPKLVQRGVGPVDIEAKSNHMFTTISFLLPSTLSPLGAALLFGYISLAQYFMDILFLTSSDLSMFARNTEMKRLLNIVRQGESLNFLQEFSSQPMSLVKLCLVTVSAAVGSSPGRETRVDSLPLPQMIKDRLLFKSTDIKHLVLSEIQPEHSTTYKRAQVNCFLTYYMGFLKYVDSDDDDDDDDDDDEEEEEEEEEDDDDNDDDDDDDDYILYAPDYSDSDDAIYCLDYD